MHNDIHGKIHFRLEIEEPATEEKVDQNYLFVSDLWKRVKRLKQICTDYTQSPFVQSLGNSFIRPPVMRTNAILKNKTLRQCLALWEFIESYENAGYSTTVQDTLLEMDEAHIRELYSTMAMEYLLFRKHVEKGFDENEELARVSTDEPLTPEIIEDLSPATVSEFTLHVSALEKKVPGLTVEETELLKTLEVALLASEVLRRRAELGDLQTKYDYSYTAKLILAQDPAQTYYSEVKNLLLSYAKVKERISWKHETFSVGRTPCARIIVKGKTPILYLPLDPEEEAYASLPKMIKAGHSGSKALPLGIKLKSKKALTIALQLIAEAMERMQLQQTSTEKQDFHFPSATREELIEQGLIKSLTKAEPEPEELPSEEPQAEQVSAESTEETSAEEASAETASEEAPAEEAISEEILSVTEVLEEADSDAKPFEETVSVPVAEETTEESESVEPTKIVEPEPSEQIAESIPTEEPVSYRPDPTSHFTDDVSEPVSPETPAEEALPAEPVSDKGEVKRKKGFFGHLFGKTDKK